MGFHVIRDEVLILNEKAELRVLVRNLDGLGDDPIAPRQTFFASAAPKKIQMGERDDINLRGCLCFSSRLRVEEGSGGKAECGHRKEKMPAPAPGRPQAREPGGASNRICGLGQTRQHTACNASG